MKRAKVTFSVSGTITETIRITDPSITISKLQKMLKSGEAVTTIQEWGSVDITATGLVIGTVEVVDNECEYTDFEVTKN
jgi:hypothetical protein